MDAVVCDALHAVWIHNDFKLSHVDAQEIDVADTKASLLIQLHTCAIFVRFHGIVTPEVESDHLIHRFADPEEMSASERDQRSIRHPRSYSGHRDIL
eukprot:6483386-Amphidinium_carterae.1